MAIIAGVLFTGALYPRSRKLRCPGAGQLAPISGQSYYTTTCILLQPIFWAADFLEAIYLHVTYCGLLVFCVRGPLYEVSWHLVLSYAIEYYFSVSTENDFLMNVNLSQASFMIHAHHQVRHVFVFSPANIPMSRQSIHLCTKPFQSDSGSGVQRMLCRLPNVMVILKNCIITFFAGEGGEYNNFEN